jgi:NADH-quinone oxidoreductase subunit M
MDVSVSFPLLTLIVALPLLGALALLFFPGEEKGLIRNVALLCTGVTFAVSLGLLSYTGAPDPGRYGALSEVFPTMEFVEDYAWIEALGARYLVGLDGISLWLVLLTTFLGPIVILSTYHAIEERVKEFMICYLLLMTGMLGALVALDGFLFYVFWELMLVPMYFLIGIWGGAERHYATMKFFLYTMVGSVLMLLSILYLYFQTDVGGAHSFALHELLVAARGVPLEVKSWLFLSFLLAFAIKVPLFPFHTWLPDAHVQAPTAGSVILAGVLLKMGTYGLLRYGMPLFPEAVVEWAPLVAILSVIGIVYGALVAMVQKDVKKLVAYSSVSHLGFCMLGMMALSAQGVEGAIFVMLAHGIATGGLFLAVGVLYERRHTKLIAEFGGLTKVVPVFATFFMIIVFTSAGLPGLAGFVGEFLVIVGTANSGVLHFGEAGWLFAQTGLGPEAGAFVFAGIAASGVIFGAVYLLWMFQRVMFGPLLNPKNEHLKDLDAREVTYFIPLIFMAFFMGFFPGVFLDRMHSSVDAFLVLMRPGLEASAAPVAVRADAAAPVAGAATLKPLDADQMRAQQEESERAARVERARAARERYLKQKQEEKAQAEESPAEKARERALQPVAPDALKLRPGAGVRLQQMFKKPQEGAPEGDAKP